MDARIFSRQVRLGPKKDLGVFLESQVPGQRSQSEVKLKGWMSVSAAITAITRNDMICGLLKDCISFAGDVDTVTAISLAAVSCSIEIDRDLPLHVVERLEITPYGRDYLIALNEIIMNTFKLNNRFTKEISL